MKICLSFILYLNLILVLSACTTAQSEQDSYLDDWQQAANLNDQKTAEELYQAALSEDTLIVYTITTRIYDVKASFEEEYPGLTVEVYDMRVYDMIDKLLNSYQNQNYACDIVVASNDDGRLTNELLPQKIINTYVPWDIEPKLIDSSKQDLLYFIIEAEQLFYNNEVYEQCPIENWWELTEPQWYGKVYMNSPLRSHPAYGLLYAVINNSQAMEQAYLDLYGEPLSLPEGLNAGHVFWQKLVENGLIFTTSSNEIVEAIGAPGQSDPPLGFMISSKIRRVDIGLNVATDYGLTPVDGVYSANSISIAGGAKNINTAKLFIRWLLGETDGQGEGLKPYLQEGVWSVRTDIESLSSRQLNDINMWQNDFSKMQTEKEQVNTFWADLQGTMHQ